MASPTTDRRLGLVGNTALKAPVTVLAAGNITQSGQQTIDGVAVLAVNAAGVADRVLCTGMTDATKNGIWDVSTAAWTRSKDADGNYDLTQGSTVLVNQGTLYAGTYWKVSNSGSITIGTTLMSWTQALTSVSTLIGWIRSAVSAVVTTVSDWLGWRAVSPLEFMSAAQRVDVLTGALLLDHTAAVQAAINTGKTVDLLGYYYKVNNLTQSTNSQAIVSTQGIARLIKNANGPILTSTADDFFMENVNWRGDQAAPTFTGDGVIAAGERPGFWNCGGRWISGAPLIATKNRVRVKGTCDLYQTTDVSGTGWDIVIGTSGTSTLYHELDEVYSSQATGGIKLIDTGSHTIKGGQFGKLSILAGTGPAGVNGGKTLAARILGAVNVTVSNALFALNQFGAVAVTLGTGTTGISIDETNSFATGYTLTNNGNLNNVMVRQVSVGGNLQFKYGDDSSTAAVTIILNDQTQQWQFAGSIVLPNTRAYRQFKADGTTLLSLVSVNASDVTTVGSLSATRTDLAGASVNIVSAAGTQVSVVDGALEPFSDNTKTLGTGALRWSTVYAAAGAINTSDEREKVLREVLESEKRAGKRIHREALCAFQFRDAVAEKGEDGARIHFGAGAQTVARILREEGLEPFRYGFVCFDEWPEQQEVVRAWEEQPEILAEDGSIVQDFRAAGSEVVRPHRAAGSRYGLRYDELFAFVLAAL